MWRGPRRRIFIVPLKVSFGTGEGGRDDRCKHKLIQFTTFASSGCTYKSDKMERMKYHQFTKHGEMVEGGNMTGGNCEGLEKDAQGRVVRFCEVRK